MAEIYFYLNKFLKEILNRVEKPEATQQLIPHVRDVYGQVWKITSERARMCELVEEYQREMKMVMEGEGEEEE